MHVCSLAFSCFRNRFRERVKMTGLRRLFLERATVQVGHWLACGSAPAEGSLHMSRQGMNLQGDFWESSARSFVGSLFKTQCNSGKSLQATVISVPGAQ